jgi:hypothetical protein
LANGLQWRIEARDVVEAGFASVGDDNSDLHFRLPH